MPTKALIVDEAAGVRSLFSRILRSLDCVTVEAADGGQAIEALEQGDIEFAIFDMDTPLVTGIDLLRAVRTSEQYSTLPVVMITEGADRGAVVEVIKLGASDCLTKPFDGDVVKSRLQRLISTTAAPARGPRPAAAGAPRAAVLIVDRNAEFRHFVANVLMSSYSILQAENGLEALRTCGQRPPSVVVLGDDTGLLAPRLLAHRLRQDPALADTRIVFVAPKDGARDVAEPDAFDAILARTFVPAEFAQQFNELFSRSESTECSAIGDIRRSVVSATEQALGMMAGADIALIDEGAVPLPPPEVEAFTVIKLQMQRVTVRLAVLCDVATAQRLGARMTGVQESEVGADDARSGLAEMVNVMAGRVKSAVTGEGESVSFTIPEARSCDPSEPPPTADTTMLFASGDRQIGLTVLLTALDASPAT